MRFGSVVMAAAVVTSAVLTRSALADGPVESVSDMPGAIVLDVATPGVGEPFGPIEFAGGGSTVTATIFGRDIGTGAIEDPFITGFFQRSSTCIPLPSRCGGTDPGVNPGDFRGRFEANTDLVVTFDAAVAGAGVSLYSNGNGGTMSTGSTITAYDGPQGTGNIIGSVTSPDTEEECCPFTTPPPWYFVYFRGITSDAGDIRSIVVSPTVASNGWGIDAIAVAPAAPAPCPADTNGDGLLTPADFNAWVVAFNSAAPECDQNADGLCNPGDFNAWIANYNAGC